VCRGSVTKGESELVSPRPVMGSDTGSIPSQFRVFRPPCLAASLTLPTLEQRLAFYWVKKCQKGAHFSPPDLAILSPPDSRETLSRGTERPPTGSPARCWRQSSGKRRSNPR